MTQGSLARALASPDSAEVIVSGTISAFAADGTCTVVDGAGAARSGVLRLDSTSLGLGDAVLLTACGPSQWLVLGRAATVAPPAATASQSWLLPWNALRSASTAANPLVVPATGSGSWRASDGWSGSKGCAVYQGWYGSSSYQRFGAFFYGANAFAAARGQRCTSASMWVHRDQGGVFAAETLHVRLHMNPTQPKSGPVWHTVGAVSVLGPAVSASGSLSLPLWMGQALMDGTAAGLGLYYGGTADYAVLVSRSTDPACGRVTLGWA